MQQAAAGASGSSDAGAKMRQAALERIEAKDKKNGDETEAKDEKTNKEAEEQTKKDAEENVPFRQRLAKMGLACVLSYGFVSNMNYSISIRYGTIATSQYGTIPDF